MEYHFRVHKEGRGYWAECVELRGCLTQAETLEALHNHCREALNLYLDEPSDSRVCFPLPNRRMVRRNVIAVPVDPQIALAMLLRMARLQKKWTQREVAERLGVPLYSYQKLERAKTANPEWKTLAKLLRLFPQVNLRFAL